jgi:hypothetical protein
VQCTVPRHIDVVECTHLRWRVGETFWERAQVGWIDFVLALEVVALSIV